MHELSIARAIVGTVTDAVGGRAVERVRLRVGLLAGVVPDALHFGWGLATAGTLLEGAVLDVEHVPLGAVCVDCRAASLHEATPPLSCPECGGRAVLTGDGRTLEITSVEMHDDAPCAAAPASPPSAPPAASSVGSSTVPPGRETAS